MSTKELVEKINTTFAEGDTEGFLSFCTDDVQWTMVGDRTVKGKEAIRQWMSAAAGGEQEPPNFTVNRIIAEDDFVTAYGDMTMKGKDGNEVPYSYCDVYRFQGDKVSELNSYVIKTDGSNEQNNNN